MTQTRPDRTLGPGHDEFWAWCAKGELRLPRCSSCGHLQWPVAEACDACEGAGFTFEAMSGRGKIASWCTFVHDYYKGAFAVPYDTIVVELEEGPLFVSNPSGFSGEEIGLDQPVAVRFEPCEDSAGPFLLPVFART